MDITLATPEELARWNDLLVHNPDGGNIFQSYEVTKVKRRGNWRPRYVIAGNLTITVLEKSVRGIGNLWYIPKGPGVTDIKSLLRLVPALKDFASKHGAFAVKIEPELLYNPTDHKKLTEAGLIPVRPIQPNHSTVLLDLSPDLETIMKNLNQKGRHAIHRAERDGVIITTPEFSRDNARAMYDLLVTTAAGRFEASIRSFEYYYEFWENFSDVSQGQLFFAHYQGKLVASAYAMYLGTKGTYKDGASVRERTAYGASHLLQWEIVRWMKSRGVTTYDLCGTPPSHQIHDTSHPHYGIGRFKTSFNKHVTDYIGAYDIVVRPRKYQLWARLGERVVLRLNALRFGESWY